MNRRAVIFDLFGTLVEDFTSSVGAVNTELAAALDAPYAPFTQKWRQTSEMRTNGTFQTVEASIAFVCETIGVQVTEKQMTRAVKTRMQQIRRALKPKPDAVTTLIRLKDDGYRIGLLSNCSIEIPILWPETPFAGLIDATVFSSRERIRKPDPRIYQLACERLGVKPEDCLYIADGENFELTAAARAGMHPVLIESSAAHSEVRREAIEWQGPTISALAEVLQLLNSAV